VIAAPHPDLVDQTLRVEGARTRQALRERLARDGELYELAAEYPGRPGKGIRPALCLAACRAFGGRTEDALGAAVALELLHNAFLVHDDICDGATLRRGGPALQARHGVPLALNAGNALAWLALEPLLENVRSLGPQCALDVLAEFHLLVRRTIEGQAAELGWRRRGCLDADVDAYLDVILDKTCWYSAIGPCRIGALIGSEGGDADAIGRYGFFLGALLQIRDDVENVTDRSLDDEFGSDIIEGKPTLLLIHLAQVANPAERAELARLLGPTGAASGVAPRERIERVVGLMEHHGSVDYTCAFADGLAGAALAEFDAAAAGLPESRDTAFLRSLPLHLRDPGVRKR
jgi:geranylgeranyl diphosphate synthase type II